jgi:DNA modification methylase
LAKWHVVWGGNSFTDSLPVSRSWAVWDKAASEEGGNWFSDFELAWTNINMAQFKIRHIHQGMIVEGAKEDKVHPTQKPVAMIEKFFDRIMKSHKGNPRLDSIVDIFLGSGSTLIACEKTNRRCFGMEIDPHYIDVAIMRWEKITGDNAYRINEDGSKIAFSEIVP